MDTRPTEQVGVWGLLLTVVVIVIASFFIDISTLKDSVASAGVWAPIVFILLKISTIIFAPLSGSPLYLVVGVIFDFWWGYLYVIVGDFIGYTLAFAISRLMGARAVNHFIGKNEHSLLARIINHISTTKGMFQVCLTCFAVPELISYGAGLSKVKYSKFIAILWPIMAIGGFFVVLLGSRIGDMENFLSVNILAIVIMVVVMLIGVSTFVTSVKNTNSLK